MSRLSLLCTLLCIAVALPITLAHVPTHHTTHHGSTTTTVAAPATTTVTPSFTGSSPCAADHTFCGTHPGASAASAFHAAAVCCPTEASVCKRTARSFRCVAKAEAQACDSCCNGGSCSFATGGSVATTATAASPSVMVPAFQSLQCCGKADGESFCCPTRAPSTRATKSEHADAHQAAANGGIMTPAPTMHAQQCHASPHAFECEDAPGLMHLSVSLAMWQLILCVVAGVVFCGAVGGGGHRAHGGHCGNDCEACTAFIGGCCLFECCCKGGGAGAGQPLLG